MTTTAATKQALAPGQQTPLVIPGTNAVVYVQRTGPATYHVWVELGGVVPGWDATFTTEAEASVEYRRAARAFHAHRTGHGIETRRQVLAIELNAQHSRMPRRMHNRDRIEEIEAELTALETFGDRRLAQQLINTLAA